MDRRVLARLMKVRDLPTLPEIIGKILETVEDERSSASDLTALLECDLAISARILRLANSPFYGLRSKVNSIRHAVVVLGFDAVRHLALATSVFDAFASRQQWALDPQDFWMHSLGAAKAAQILSSQHCRVESPEGCFTAGLLHDIGKFLLALVLKEEYREVVQEAKQSQRLLRDVEREKHRMTHPEVGQWIAERWQLPAMITDTIGNRYRVARYAGPNKTEVAIVALADDISRKAGFGVAGDYDDPPVAQDVLEILSLREETVDAIVSALDQVRDETRQFLNVLESN